MADPEIIASGDWWSLDDAGTLRIFCVGNMPVSEWLGYSKKIRFVVISDGVTSISNSAFFRCYNLRSVTIPDGVTSIGNYAFYYCRDMEFTSVTLPDSLTSIGECAFCNCENLTSVTTPASLTTIGEYAFGDCSKLANAPISDSVISIGPSAFRQCHSLTSVTIPQGVTNIEDYAFGWCWSLTSVTIPDSVTRIGKWAFASCSLGNVTIPDSVTSIGNHAFYGCSALTSVTIPPRVTYLEAVVFADCTHLASVIIPDSVTTVEYHAFSGCASLTDAYYPGTEAQWDAIRFNYGNDALLNAHIHFNYVPPDMLHIGGALAYGRIVGAKFSINLSADASEIAYVASASLDGDTVAADEITVTFRQPPDDWQSQWSGVNKNTPVWLDSPRRLEKYFFKQLVRVGRDKFEIAAQSPIARLTSDFPGGLYDGQPLPDVIADVIGDIIPFTCNPLLSSVRVYGWTPYQSPRETIHALAFAYGFLILRDENLDLRFTVPPSDSYPLPDNNIFVGGSVDYRIGESYARIDVAAKDFYPDSDATPQTLFDNSSGAAPADNLIVTFDSPMFDLSVAGYLTIQKDADGNDRSGPNYAVVSGIGILSGKPYAVSSAIVSVQGDPDADPENVLSVSDAPLITTLNAVAVAEKLRDSRCATVVNMDILRSVQRPGDLVEFTDPFGDPQTGYITSLSGSITSIDRASASFLCGYSPAWGAAYDDVFVLDGSGDWTVPDYLDGKTLRVVLIGGGAGGASGQHGSDANATGSGRGLPGKGGNVREIKVLVRAGETYQYQCGDGGAAGTPTDEITYEMPLNMTVYVTPTGDRYHLKPHDGSGSYAPVTLQDAIRRGLTPCETCFHDQAPYYVSNPGENGADTLFGDFSSEDGLPSDTGFYDVIHETRYALPGADNGVDGGAATSGAENGDKTAPAWRNVQQYAVSLPWDGAQSWTSGQPGDSYTHTESGAIDEWAYGGLGGGAAVGNDGGNGGNGGFRAYVKGGAGGDGANASPLFPPDSLPFGSGGSGGHGGGEGGAGGSGHADEWQAEDGPQGSGGSGSPGQSGANGCILIYYKKPDAYQYRFSIQNGRLILTYYTETPPPFSRSDKRLIYAYPDGETPPDFHVKNRHLYLRKGGN